MSASDRSVVEAQRREALSSRSVAHRECTRMRFGLKRFLLFCTCVSLVLVIVSQDTRRHWRAQKAAWRIADLGGSVHWNPELHETVLRDWALTRITDVTFNNTDLTNEHREALAALPQRFGLHVHGSEFGDLSLGALKSLPNLRYLVLNDTSVTDQGVSELKSAVPGVTVMYGYPGDPEFRQIP